MQQPPPHWRRLISLNDLTRLMAHVADLRRAAVAAVMAGRPIPEDAPAQLAHALTELHKAAGRDHVVELIRGDDVSLRLNLAEEIRQLENDAVYLEDGREALFKRLGKHRPGLRDAIRRGLKIIAGESVNALVCDCDALFRPASQRLRTAVQPAWNAVAACRFAMARCRKPVLWSEAPLTGPGIVERATVPPTALVSSSDFSNAAVSSSSVAGRRALPSKNMPSSSRRLRTAARSPEALACRPPPPSDRT